MKGVACTGRNAVLLIQSKFCGPQESRVEKKQAVFGGRRQEKFKEGCEEKGTKKGKEDICF